MALSDAKVKAAKVPEGKKQLKLSDAGGLHILVKESGKYWRMSYRYGGKQKTLSLGKYPLVTLKGARSKREEAKRLLDDNIDPNQAKQAEKHLGIRKDLVSFPMMHDSPTELGQALEVKDWKSETIKKLTVVDVTLQTNNGMVIKPHPLLQVRQCTYAVINRLSCDPQLRQAGNKHQGNLVMPYGWGVVFTNITRKQIKKAIPDDLRETLFAAMKAFGLTPERAHP